MKFNNLLHFYIPPIRCGPDVANNTPVNIYVMEKSIIKALPGDSCTTSLPAEFPHNILCLALLSRLTSLFYS